MPWQLMNKKKGHQIKIKKNDKEKEEREALATNSATRGIIISCEEN